MAIDKTASHVKGRNVQPLSSTLRVQTLPADCSGTDWDVTPEDGEWLFFKGYGTAATHEDAELTSDGTDTGLGTCLRMVWGHRDASDRTAMADKRVTVVFQQSLHCMLGLYNYDAAALPQPGWLITVDSAQEVVNGDTSKERLVAQPKQDHAAGEHWIVGYVLAAPAAAGDPIEVLLYDAPRLVTRA